LDEVAEEKKALQASICESGLRLAGGLVHPIRLENFESFAVLNGYPRRA
jgi:hypothetical protein